MVAAHGDDHVGGHVIVVDLRRAVRRRIAVRTQHVGGAFVGGVTSVPAPGARTGDPHDVGETAFLDLVREHLLRHR